MHLIIQPAGAVGMGTFEPLLIFGVSEVGFHMFVPDVFSRPGLHPLFVREHLVAHTEAAHWIVRHNRVQLPRFSLLNVSALECIEPLFHDWVGVSN